MRGFEFAEELVCRAGAALARILDPLTYAFARVGLRYDIEKALIGFRILNYSGSFAVNRQDYWPLAFLDLL